MSTKTEIKSRVWIKNKMEKKHKNEYDFTFSFATFKKLPHQEDDEDEEDEEAFSSLLAMFETE